MILSLVQHCRFTVRPYSVEERLMSVCAAVGAFGEQGDMNLDQWQRSTVIKTLVTSMNVTVRLWAPFDIFTRSTTQKRSASSRFLQRSGLIGEILSSFLHFNWLKGNSVRLWEAIAASCPSLKRLKLDMIWGERNFICNPPELLVGITVTTAPSSPHAKHWNSVQLLSFMILELCEFYLFFGCSFCINPISPAIILRAMFLSSLIVFLSLDPLSLFLLSIFWIESGQWLLVTLASPIPIKPFSPAARPHPLRHISSPQNLKQIPDV